MIRVALPAIALGSGLLGDGSPVQGAVSGGFLTTLGNDTVAAERYTRTKDRLEGDILLRVPGTTRYHYEIAFDHDGAVKKSSFQVRPLGAPSVG